MMLNIYKTIKYKELCRGLTMNCVDKYQSLQQKNKELCDQLHRQGIYKLQEQYKPPTYLQLHSMKETDPRPLPLIGGAFFFLMSMATFMYMYCNHASRRLCNHPSQNHTL
jgi:hypothetical protein